MADETQVPEGGLGQIIEGPPAAVTQEQGKVQQFFTDPKNLATMLVLATALSQPKGNRSGLGHGLRSATGALAFRGGLDQELTEQEQQATEAASVVSDRTSAATHRTRTAAAADERNRLEGERIEITDENQDLDRASRERIAATNRTEITPRPMTLQDAITAGQKEAADAYVAWIASGQFGPPPDENAIMSRHMRNFELIRNNQLPQFEATPTADGTVPRAEELAPPRRSAKNLSGAVRKFGSELGFQPGEQVDANEVDRRLTEVLNEKIAGITTAQEARRFRSENRQYLSLDQKVQLEQLEKQLKGEDPDIIAIPSIAQSKVEAEASARTKERQEAQSKADAPHGGRTKF